MPELIQNLKQLWTETRILYYTNAHTTQKKKKKETTRTHNREVVQGVLQLHAHQQVRTIKTGYACRSSPFYLLLQYSYIRNDQRIGIHFNLHTNYKLYY